MATRLAEIVNTEWRKITTIGDNGTCWKKSDGGIFVCSTDQEGAATLPLSNTNVTLDRAKRVPLDEDSPEVLQLNPLSPDDAFYALSLKDSAQIVIDSLLGNFGPELITDIANRNFSLGQRDWVLAVGTEVTWDNVSMNFACTVDTRTDLPLTISEGGLHRYEFEIIEYTSGGIFLRVGLGETKSVTEAVGVFVVYLVAGAQNLISFASSNFIGKIDNVSLKAVL